MTMQIDRLSPSETIEDTFKILDTLELDTGLKVQYVDVPDGFEGNKYRVQRAATQAVLNSHESYLRYNPDITLDSPNNRARDYLDSIPAVFSWKGMMPSAMALYPLQRPDEEFLPNGTRVDKVTQQLFRHGIDAIGIRSRAKIMESISYNVMRTSESSVEWISLACGSALPVLDAVNNIKQKLPGKNINLSLVDWDDQALAFARGLAENQGLEEGLDFTAENQDLIRGLVLGDKLVQTLGEESYDMVDMMGIFEYFDDKRATKLLKNAYRLVKPGGKIVIGNMLDTHTNLRLNQAAVGWPGVKPRSLEEISEVIKSAGIDTTLCNTYVPEDGVYAVVEIGKEASNSIPVPVQRQLGAAAITY